MADERGERMSGRVEVRAELVPALPRGVKLRFDQARNAWVLLAPERVLMPDPIAVEILQRCDGKRSVGSVIDDLAATFTSERAQIETDVVAFLQDLADKGMLVLDRA
jgi:pyrroloquinoline quinone biosynthesis protein D